MNAKLKCKLNNQMTVTSQTPLPFKHPFSSKAAKQVFNPNAERLSVEQQNCHKNAVSVDFKSSQRPDQPSSLILRQKLLHRHKNGSLGASANTSKTGRKSYSRNQNNGFKFHNFVVNEDKRSCLEEQHGTKKITVSHWKRPNTTNTTPIEVNEDLPESVADSSPPSHSILETLLAPNSHTIEDKQRVNKRKPLHVRRVLRQQRNQRSESPEPQPQDEPLDLSFKRIDFNIPTKKSEMKKLTNRLVIDSNPNEMFSSESPTESVQHLIKTVNRSAAQASAIIASVKCPNSAKFSSNVSSNSSNDPSIAQRQQIAVNSAKESSKQQKYRQTQRSLIKKQLEETFKQNGFLVKTKQVSDANNSAMFCKFRQLRKYTRYYLKSWHHHLPDEVNKLWKGFLPPKTEKPNSSHNN